MVLNKRFIPQEILADFEHGDGGGGDFGVLIQILVKYKYSFLKILINYFSGLD